MARSPEARAGQLDLVGADAQAAIVDDPGIYTAVRSGDFLADAKIAWRDAYEMQMRLTVRPLQQAGGVSSWARCFPGNGCDKIVAFCRQK
jgi:hypothetical protein